MTAPNVLFVRKLSFVIEFIYFTLRTFIILPAPLDQAAQDGRFRPGMLRAVFDRAAQKNSRPFGGFDPTSRAAYCVRGRMNARGVGYFFLVGAGVLLAAGLALV